MKRLNLHLWKILVMSQSVIYKQFIYEGNSFWFFFNKIFSTENPSIFCHVYIYIYMIV